MLIFLCVMFVLSGAAGLIYESIWTRYLGLFVGHSAYAQVLVLIIFLGGMSLGAVLVGRRSERVRQPLLWYALVELAVGVIGLVFHDVFLWATEGAYLSLFPALGLLRSLTVAHWDVSPDDRRFLFTRFVEAPGAASSNSATVVIQVDNWLLELQSGGARRP